MKDLTYHDFILHDLLGHFPNITSRPMMSGWCIYSKAIPFAAIIGDELYMKGLGNLAEYFQSLGWKRFSYKKSNNKTVNMNYWKVPGEFIDNQGAFDELMEKVL